MQLIGMEFCTHRSGNLMILMRTFVEGVQDIANSSQSLKLSEHSLIGEFLGCLIFKINIVTQVIYLDE